LITTTYGALKEGLKSFQKDLKLFICGGKGKASRITAKVDNNALRDGYQIYHHTFFAAQDGKWAVIQQEMNPLYGWARRYHWLSDMTIDYVNEPHTGIVSIRKGPILDLTAKESKNNRKISTKISQSKPEKIVNILKKLKETRLPKGHHLLLRDINPQKLETIFLKTYKTQPQRFEQLLEIPTVGPKTIRALSLISELVYGVPFSTRDPARSSFAHGGKDGIPYPVDRETYNQSILFLREAIKKAHLGYYEKLHCLKRL